MSPRNLETQAGARARAPLVAASLGSAMALLGAGILAALPARAQAPPPTPVRYTEAREHAVRREIRLPGSVLSRTVSLVASEIEGSVIEVRVREGDRVKEGQVLARLRTAPLDLRLRAATAERREAEARLKLAERGLERARDLFSSGALSQQQLDEAFYEVNAWQGRVEKLGADIAQIELALERSSIRTPFAGVVVSRRTEVGEWIELGDPVAEILALDDLEVQVETPERYYDSLRPGAVVGVTFEALPGLEVSGRVSAIIPRADPQARTFPIKVRLPNVDARIGAGMLAHVALPVGEEVRAIVVPKDAVVAQGASRYVYLLNGDSNVSAVTVKTGAGVGSWVVVEGDVRPGHKVVTRGNERLRPGQPVRGEPLEYALP